MVKPIEWDSLTHEEKRLLVAAGETSPLAFTAIWFNIMQGEVFKANWHHYYFEWAAQEMLSGRATNIIVNVAPSSTKTEFWSIHFPAFCATQYDLLRILNTSYSKDLVTENSERTRALMKSGEWQEMYPHRLAKDTSDNWTALVDGKQAFQMFSRSSGGQITGVRGGYMRDGFSGYISADDWQKAEDMFSDAKRNRSNTILANTLRSRRGKKTDGDSTPFLFIQQRLHVDDGTAFILSGGMGLSVDLHIKIPALIDQEYIDSLPDGIRERCIKDVCGSPCVDGQWSFWPDVEGIQGLLDLKRAHPYTFSSQYMHDPNSLDGGIFDAGDFVYYGDPDDGADLPAPERFDYRIITVDTAQKTNEWNDWSVFAEWGVTKERIYRLSYKRARMKANELRASFEPFVKEAYAKNGGANGVLRKVLVEDKVSGTGLIQEMQGRLPIAVTAVQRNKDKLTRAMDVQPHHLAKKVALPYGDRHNFEFVSEVASFSHDDTHKFDDQTDVMIDALEEAFVSPQPVTRAVKIRI